MDSTMDMIQEIDDRREELHAEERRRQEAISAALSRHGQEPALLPAKDDENAGLCQKEPAITGRGA